MKNWRTVLIVVSIAMLAFSIASGEWAKRQVLKKRMQKVRDGKNQKAKAGKAVEEIIQEVLKEDGKEQNS